MRRDSLNGAETNDIDDNAYALGKSHSHPLQHVSILLICFFAALI